MKRHMFSVGSRVRVVSYSPYRGIRGTVRTIHSIPPLEEPFCFYQIELEGTHMQEPIWFPSEEVELLSPFESLSLERV